MAGLLLPMATAVLVLVVPGYLLARLAGVARVWSACSAPSLSLAIFSVLVTVYAMGGIPANKTTVLLAPSALLGVALLALLWRRSRVLHDASPEAQGGAARRASVGPGTPITLPHLPAAWLALYALAGLVVCRFVFLSMLPASDAIAVARDMPHHINQVRAFLDSGRWSSLRADLFQTPADMAVDPISPGGTGFYPSTWHAVCALVVQLSGASVMAAINATNAAFMAVVLPLATLGVLAFFFDSHPDRQRILLAGSILCVSFVAFPWRAHAYGPIYPNVCGFCAMLSCAWAPLRLADDNVRLEERLRLAVLFAISLVGVAFLHPNAAIAVCLYVVPYLGMRVLRARQGWHVAGHCVPAQLALVVFLVAGACVWYAVYRAPFLRAIVNTEWELNLSGAQGLVNWLTLAYLNLGTFGRDLGQPVLAVVVLVGMLWTLRNREWLWVSLTYVAGCVPFLGSFVVRGQWRHILAGFWYTDPPRLAALAAICGVPVAALGLAFLMRLATRLLRVDEKRDAGMGLRHELASREVGLPGCWASVRDVCATGVRTACVPCVVLVLFAVANFFPGVYPPGVEDGDLPEMTSDEDPYKIRSPFEEQRLYYRDSCFPESGLYGRAQRAFMRRVYEEVGPNEVVVNNPFDGSVFAYGDCGVRTYYRRLLGFEDGAETQESRVVRSSLVNVAQAESVAEVVRRLGLHYVVKLGRVKGDGSAFRWNYAEPQWLGIDWIGPDTPGFELVFEEGDMQLYRIAI